MKKNILSIMLAAAMTGTLLAGCGSGSGGSVAGKAFGGNTSAGQFLLGGIGMMILGVLTWILVLRKFPVSVKNNSAVIGAD